MLKTQKHLFNLAKDTIYLNGAYMSPQLKKVESVGIENLKRKNNPFLITESDFFSEKDILRNRFSKLIHANDSKRIAIIPSVSFGIATAVKNIPFSKGDEIIILEEQFPSNYYIWKELEAKIGVVIKTIKAPKISLGRAQRWNQDILDAITSKTKCIALPHIHWADGVKFNLKAIRNKTNDVNAYLIIDGTQSIGVLPFSVKEINPDALICAGYKWLMGPYGIGLTYFGKRFDQGIPLDDNWMNHIGSEDFSNLVNYNHNFKPKALRYDSGGSSNFITVPMLSEGIKQLLEWKPQAIQSYCENITQKTILELQHLGYFIETPEYRSHHLFGIYLPKKENILKIKSKVYKNKISISFRGNAIRISPGVYNTKEDLEKLLSCFV